MSIQIDSGSISKNMNADDTWNLSLKDKYSVNLTNDKEVSVGYRLLKVDDNGYLRREVMKKQNLKATTLQALQSDNFLLNLPTLSGGRYELIVESRSIRGPSETWGAQDSLKFTLSNSDLTVGWDKELPQGAPASNEKNEISTVISDPFSSDYGTYDNQPPVNVGGLTTLAAVTASGRWMHYNRGRTSTTGISKAVVEVRYIDNFYIWRTAATTTTDGLGNWSAT